MNSMLLRTLNSVPKTPSLLAFSEYREAEQSHFKHQSVSSTGALLEYETVRA